MRHSAQRQFAPLNLDHLPPRRLAAAKQQRRAEAEARRETLSDLLDAYVTRMETLSNVLIRYGGVNVHTLSFDTETEQRLSEVPARG